MVTLLVSQLSAGGGMLAQAFGSRLFLLTQVFMSD